MAEDKKEDKKEDAKKEPKTYKLESKIDINGNFKLTDVRKFLVQFNRLQKEYPDMNEEAIIRQMSQGSSQVSFKRNLAYARLIKSWKIAKNEKELPSLYDFDKEVSKHRKDLQTIKDDKLKESSDARSEYVKNASRYKGAVSKLRASKFGKWAVRIAAVALGIMAVVALPAFLTSFAVAFGAASMAGAIGLLATTIAGGYFAGRLLKAGYEKFIDRMEKNIGKYSKEVENFKAPYEKSKEKYNQAEANASDVVDRYNEANHCYENAEATAQAVSDMSAELEALSPQRFNKESELFAQELKPGEKWEQFYANEGADIIAIRIEAKRELDAMVAPTYGELEALKQRTQLKIDQTYIIDAQTNAKEKLDLVTATAIVLDSFDARTKSQIAELNLVGIVNDTLNVKAQEFINGINVNEQKTADEREYTQIELDAFVKETTEFIKHYIKDVIDEKRTIEDASISNLEIEEVGLRYDKIVKIISNEEAYNAAVPGRAEVGINSIIAGKSPEPGFGTFAVGADGGPHLIALDHVTPEYDSTTRRIDKYMPFWEARETHSKEMQKFILETKAPIECADATSIRNSYLVSILSRLDVDIDLLPDDRKREVLIAICDELKKVQPDEEYKNSMKVDEVVKKVEKVVELTMFIDEEALERIVNTVKENKQLSDADKHSVRAHKSYESSYAKLQKFAYNCIINSVDNNLKTQDKAIVAPLAEALIEAVFSDGKAKKRDSAAVKKIKTLLKIKPEERLKGIDFNADVSTIEKQIYDLQIKFATIVDSTFGDKTKEDGTKEDRTKPTREERLIALRDTYKTYKKGEMTDAQRLEDVDFNPADVFGPDFWEENFQVVRAYVNNLSQTKKGMEVLEKRYSGMSDVLESILGKKYKEGKLERNIVELYSILDLNNPTEEQIVLQMDLCFNLMTDLGAEGILLSTKPENLTLDKIQENVEHLMNQMIRLEELQDSPDDAMNDYTEAAKTKVPTYTKDQLRACAVVSVDGNYDITELKTLLASSESSVSLSDLATKSYVDNKANLLTHILNKLDKPYGYFQSNVDYINNLVNTKINEYKTKLKDDSSAVATKTEVEKEFQNCQLEIENDETMNLLAKNEEVINAIKESTNSRGAFSENTVNSIYNFLYESKWFDSESIVTKADLKKWTKRDDSLEDGKKDNFFKECDRHLTMSQVLEAIRAELEERYTRKDVIFIMNDMKASFETIVIVKNGEELKLLNVSNCETIPEYIDQVAKNYQPITIEELHTECEKDEYYVQFGASAKGKIIDTVKFLVEAEVNKSTVSSIKENKKIRDNLPKTIKDSIQTAQTKALDETNNLQTREDGNQIFTIEELKSKLKTALSGAYSKKAIEFILNDAEVRAEFAKISTLIEMCKDDTNADETKYDMDCLAGKISNTTIMSKKSINRSLLVGKIISTNRPKLTFERKGSDIALSAEISEAKYNNSLLDLSTKYGVQGLSALTSSDMDSFAEGAYCAIQNTGFNSLNQAFEMLMTKKGCIPVADLESSTLSMVSRKIYDMGYAYDGLPEEDKRMFRDFAKVTSVLHEEQYGEAVKRINTLLRRGSEYTEKHINDIENALLTELAKLNNDKMYAKESYHEAIDNWFVEKGYLSFDEIENLVETGNASRVFGKKTERDFEVTNESSKFLNAYPQDVIDRAVRMVENSKFYTKASLISEVETILGRDPSYKTFADQDKDMVDLIIENVTEEVIEPIIDSFSDIPANQEFLEAYFSSMMKTQRDYVLQYGILPTALEQYLIRLIKKEEIINNFPTNEQLREMMKAQASGTHKGKHNDVTIEQIISELNESGWMEKGLTGSFSAGGKLYKVLTKEDIINRTNYKSAKSHAFFNVTDKYVTPAELEKELNAKFDADKTLESDREAYREILLDCFDEVIACRKNGKIEIEIQVADDDKDKDKDRKYDLDGYFEMLLSQLNLLSEDEINAECEKDKYYEEFCPNAKARMLFTVQKYVKEECEKQKETSSLDNVKLRKRLPEIVEKGVTFATENISFIDNKNKELKVKRVPSSRIYTTKQMYGLVELALSKMYSEKTINEILNSFAVSNVLMQISTIGEIGAKSSLGSVLGNAIDSLGYMTKDCIKQTFETGTYHKPIGIVVEADSKNGSYGISTPGIEKVTTMPSLLEESGKDVLKSVTKEYVSVYMENPYKYTDYLLRDDYIAKIEEHGLLKKQDIQNSIRKVVVNIVDKLGYDLLDVGVLNAVNRIVEELAEGKEEGVYTKELIFRIVKEKLADLLNAKEVEKIKEKGTTASKLKPAYKTKDIINSVASNGYDKKSIKEVLKSIVKVPQTEMELKSSVLIALKKNYMSKEELSSQANLRLDEKGIFEQLYKERGFNSQEKIKNILASKFNQIVKEDESYKKDIEDGMHSSLFDTKLKIIISSYMTQNEKESYLKSISNLNYDKRITQNLKNKRHERQALFVLLAKDKNAPSLFAFDQNTIGYALTKGVISIEGPVDEIEFNKQSYEAMIKAGYIPTDKKREAIIQIAGEQFKKSFATAPQEIGRLFAFICIDDFGTSKPNVLNRTNLEKAIKSMASTKRAKDITVNLSGKYSTEQRNAIMDEYIRILNKGEKIVDPSAVIAEIVKNMSNEKTM